jgi:hypothetical protein
MRMDSSTNPAAYSIKVLVLFWFVRDIIVMLL